MRAIATICAPGFVFLAYVYLTLPDVRMLASTNPETTAFMALRAAEAAGKEERLRHVQVWVPYSQISQNLKRAVLVAEDAAFWQHEGVDVEQIRESIRAAWKEGSELRGASTITQQLAKNLYLSPSRDPLRKLRELIIARRLEAALSKTRIFELYLNVIEWGGGIWGAEAAAHAYFGVPASSLNAEQAALLAGAIINPRVLNPARPNARLRARRQIILSRMGDVGAPSSTHAITAPAGGPGERELLPSMTFPAELPFNVESASDAGSSDGSPEPSSVTAMPESAPVAEPSAPLAPTPADQVDFRP